jgi:alcohol dehydrogenase
MRAAIYEEFGKPFPSKIYPTKPTDTGVVIKVEATRHLPQRLARLDGHDPEIHLPHVPGHELAGVIAAVGKQVERGRWASA